MKKGMFPEDLLVIDNVCDNPSERSIFPTLGKPIGDKIALYIVDLLGLGDRLYEKETIYNINNESKKYNLIMNQSFRINFRNNRFILLEERQKLNIWKN